MKRLSLLLLGVLLMTLTQSCHGVSSTWSNPGTTQDLSDSALWSAVNWSDEQAYIGTSAPGSVNLTIRPWTTTQAYVHIPADFLSPPIHDTDYTVTVTVWQDEDNLPTNSPYGPADFRMNLYVVSKLNANEDEKWRWFGSLDNDKTCYGVPGSDDGCRVLYDEDSFVSSIPLGEASASSFSSTFQLSSGDQMQLVLVLHAPDYFGTSNAYLMSGLTLERHPRSRSFPVPLSGAPEVVADVRAPVVPEAPATDCPHQQAGLRDWHDPTTWGGSVPTGGDVTLPDNMNILLSSWSINSAQSFGTIRVPQNSSLVFNDTDMALRVGNIVVDGYLAIGSPTCRLDAYITITLLDSAEDLGSHLGRKGIVTTRTGRMDIHGKLYQKTWTRLASSADVLDDRIQVTDDINWEVGQQVVVLTSIWRDHEDNQNEVRTIAAIDGRKIQFTEPLQFFHYAGPEYQVEVALLSRRILIQGDEASEVNRQGGHIMSHGTEARLSGVQGYRLGQTNVLARYPFHFHLMGSAPDSYMEDCSVYHSFFRCFTIHGTNDTRVSRNTAFDVLGHCYYLEDGVEENNLFEYNLAAYPQPVKEIDFSWDYSQQGPTMYQAPDLLIPADAAPSGFYISNANNQFVGNAGSGGFAVFSFINFPTPIGDFRAVAGFSPMERPLGRFYGNSAHSAGYQWTRAACIYVGGLQYYDPDSPDQLVYNIGRHERDTRDLDGQEDFFRFEENRVFICNRGLNHWGERAEALGYEAHDVTKGLTLFGDAFVKNALIEGRSGNPLADFPDQRGFEWYDTYVRTIVSDVTFRNFAYAGPDDPEAFDLRTYVFTSLTHSDKYKPQGINAARGISFVNVWNGGRIGNKIRDTGASRFYNIIDYDNSILEHPRAGNSAVLLGSANNQTYYSSEYGASNRQIKDWWLFDGHDCVLYPQYIMWACRKHDDNEVVSINLDVDGYTNDFETYISDWSEKDPGINVGTVSQFGHAGEDRRSAIITANPGVTGLSGDSGWYIHFDAGSPQDLRIRISQLPNVNGTHMHVIGALKYPAAAQFDFRAHHIYQPSLRVPMTEVDTFEQVYNDDLGLSYTQVPAPSGEKWLMFKLIDRNYDYRDPSTQGFFERDGMRVYDSKVWLGGYSYLLSVTCDGCVSENVGTDGAIMYPVLDEIPPFVYQLRA